MYNGMNNLCIVVVVLSASELCNIQVWVSHGTDIAEQRRRDRINEKMRALQELIPNCNKVGSCTSISLII